MNSVLCSSILSIERVTRDWKGIFGIFGRMRLTMLLSTVCSWLDISSLVYHLDYDLLSS